MPREHFGPGFAFLARSELLRFEEIARLSRVFAGFGVKKLRLTGGEPLLRTALPTLVRLLADIPGVEVALTTNGALLSAHARALADAGLARLTVSLDSLDDAVFRRMNDTEYGVKDVLDGIRAAGVAGFASIKLNCVVRRGVNDGQVVELARHFRGTGHVVRFIEYMDVGSTNGWASADVVSGREIIDTIDAAFPVEPLEASYPGEVAKRWRYRDGSGEIGIITSVTQPFCGDCSRARLSADGNLYTCLFASRGTDVRTALRSGATDDALAELIRGAWSRRADRYSELRAAQPIRLRRIEMSYIGG
jgi:cyclic pyranopterin phosphate synthase